MSDMQDARDAEAHAAAKAETTEQWSAAKARANSAVYSGREGATEEAMKSHASPLTPEPMTMAGSDYYTYMQDAPEAGTYEAAKAKTTEEWAAAKVKINET